MTKPNPFFLLNQDAEHVLAPVATALQAAGASKTARRAALRAAARRMLRLDAMDRDLKMPAKCFNREARRVAAKLLA